MVQKYGGHICVVNFLKRVHAFPLVLAFFVSGFSNPAANQWSIVASFKR